MNNWMQARGEWVAFVEALEAAQFALHCSYRNAWFRGHECERYLLLPSAFRDATPPGLGPLATWNANSGPCREDLRRPEILEIDGLKLSSVNGVREAQLLNEVDLKIERKVLETDVRTTLRDIRIEVQGKLNAIWRIEREMAEAPKQSAPGVAPDPAYRAVLQARHHELKAQQSDFRQQVARLRERIIVLRSIVYGERHSLLAFRQRRGAVAVGSGSPSSWMLLALMQHHGVTTRLLDWTTSAGVAVFFAVKAFRKVMIDSEGSISNWLEHYNSNIDLELFNKLEEPVVWVLNPYFLARRTTGFNRIDDPTVNANMDYLDQFHEQQSWPFNGAMPAIIPWQAERMLSQRGTFTIQGRDTRPIEQQLHLYDPQGSKRSRGAMLAKVKLSRAASLYAVRHVVQFFGLDQFSMFRGEDDLGQAVAEEGRRRRRTTGDALNQGPN